MKAEQNNWCNKREVFYILNSFTFFVYFCFFLIAFSSAFRQMIYFAIPIEFFFAKTMIICIGFPHKMNDEFVLISSVKVEDLFRNFFWRVLVYENVTQIRLLNRSWNFKIFKLEFFNCFTLVFNVHNKNQRLRC